MGITTNVNSQNLRQSTTKTQRTSKSQHNLKYAINDVLNIETESLEEYIHLIKGEGVAKWIKRNGKKFIR